MRKLFFTVFGIVVVLTLTAAPFFKAAKAQDSEPLKIGLLTDLSAALALYGVELENGFTLGLEYATDGTLQVAGRPIEIVVRDYANDADLAATQARELIEVEEVEMLVGAPSSGVTLGLIDIAAEYDVVLMVGPAADTRITGEFFKPTTFRACRNNYHDWLNIASWAVDVQGLMTYAELAPDYGYGYSAVAAAHYAFGLKGATFVQDPVYAPQDTADFAPYIQQLIDSGADGALVTWAGTGSITLFSQINEIGLGMDETKPLVLTSFNSNDIVKAWFDETSLDPIGLITYHYTAPNTGVNDWLVERHREDYDGDVPDLFTECGFASAQALVYALQATGGSTQTGDLIPALEGLEWEGPKGAYTIRPEDHQALMPQYIVRLVNLDDPDQAYYELVTETSAEDTAPPCESGADRSSDTLDCTPLAERSQ